MATRGEQKPSSVLLPVCPVPISNNHWATLDGSQRNSNRDEKENFFPFPPPPLNRTRRNEETVKKNEREREREKRRLEVDVKRMK